MLSKIIEYKFESGILLEIPIVSPTQSKKNWTFHKMPFGILQKVQYLIQRTYQPVLKGTTWPRFMGTNLLMYNRLLNCLSTWNIPFLFFYPNWTLTAKIREKNNFFLKIITLLFLFCENELSVARILDQVVPWTRKYMIESTLPLKLELRGPKTGDQIGREWFLDRK